jgi:hypothetical protein
VETSISSSVLPERQLLVQWLGRTTRRMQARSRLRELGWMVCTVLSALGIYLLLDALGVPIPALIALAALLLLGVGAAAAFFAWRCVHRTDLSSAAGEADSRLDLKDELKTAFWFARDDVPSATEVLMLRHAAETVRRLDPRVACPLRIPGNFGAAAVLGVIALGLAFAGHDTTTSTVACAGLAGGSTNSTLRRPFPPPMTRTLPSGNSVAALSHPRSCARVLSHRFACRRTLRGAVPPWLTRLLTELSTASTRKTPLVISNFNSVPLKLDLCQHLRLRNFMIRGGGHNTLMLAMAINVDIEITEDHEDVGHEKNGKREIPSPMGCQVKHGGIVP